MKLQEALKKNIRYSFLKFKHIRSKAFVFVVKGRRAEEDEGRLISCELVCNEDRWVMDRTDGG